ncbi:MAG: glycosyltransferase family 4 protein [Prevotella sp.]|nr:glycosyltransferase family 4 protein [Prevotella sp.]
MKKLLFCTQSYITGGGGVASYAHDFIEAFAERYDISVVTSDKYEKNEDDVTEIYHVNGGDFTVDNARRMLQLIGCVGPDVVVNSSFPLVALLAPYLADRIKLVNVSHFVDGILAWYAGFNAEYADHIISLSSYGKEYLERKFNISDKEKTRVVFNFMPELGPLSEKKQDQHPLKIVYPGGCSYAKSAEVVCLALKRLLRTDLEFEFYWLGSTKIAGGGSNRFRTRHVEDCIEKDRRVVQMGPVPRDRSKEILANANIFLLPSRGEGFPITLIEAMRSGCIVIVSDARHGSLDAIKNGVNGIIVKQGSAKAIVQEISGILHHPEKFNHLYAASYRYYQDHLTQKVWKDNMGGVLDADSAHQRRQERFDESRYLESVRRLRGMVKGYWMRDRLHQLYHFVAFRWIRYCG